MSMKQKLVVLTGAGMSAESGIPTFRGAGGLWEGYRAEEVATPGAWERDFRLVLDFYNFRRKAVIEAQPNRGHEILAELEENFDVEIITQNIDNLHERAGSTKVIHLHGEIIKARSTQDPKLIYDIDGWELKEGMHCELGSQLRPHIVWFGESVPMIEPAAAMCGTADLFLIVGTSLQVYPASGLIHAVANQTPKFIVDPNVPRTHGVENLKTFPKGASEGLEELAEILKRM